MSETIPPNSACIQYSLKSDALFLNSDKSELALKVMTIKNEFKSTTNCIIEGFIYHSV